MKISLAFVHKYRISDSSSCTCFPGLLPLTSRSRSMTESKSTSFCSAMVRLPRAGQGEEEGRRPDRAGGRRETRSRWSRGLARMPLIWWETRPVSLRWIFLSVARGADARQGSLGGGRTKLDFRPCSSQEKAQRGSPQRTLGSGNEVSRVSKIRNRVKRCLSRSGSRGTNRLEEVRSRRGTASREAGKALFRRYFNSTPRQIRVEDGLADDNGYERREY